MATDSTLIKLIILYAMDKMDVALEEDVLTDLCTNDHDWMNYMDCKDALAALDKRSGQVHGGGGLTHPAFLVGYGNNFHGGYSSSGHLPRQGDIVLAGTAACGIMPAWIQRMSWWPPHGS